MLSVISLPREQPSLLLLVELRRHVGHALRLARHPLRRARQRVELLATLAQRVGVTPASLARYNGIEENDPLRAGEVVALPNRVSEPSGTNGGTDIAFGEDVGKRFKLLK